MSTRHWGHWKMGEFVGGIAHLLPFQPQALAGGSRHTRGAAAVVYGRAPGSATAQDLLYQAVTAQPPSSHGSPGMGGYCRRHLSIYMFCISHSRSRELLGRSPSRTGQPEDGQPKGLGLGKLEGWQGQTWGSFTPQTWESAGMPQQHPRKIRAGAELVHARLGWTGLQTAQCFCNRVSQHFCRLLSNVFSTCWVGHLKKNAVPAFSHIAE